MQIESTTNEQETKPSGERTPRGNYAPMLQAMKLAQSQRYIPRKHAQINRQPRRLEFTVSRTKQTCAPPINRQQMRTLHPAFFAAPATSQITNLPRRQAGHESQTCLAGRRVTSHGRSNRHSVRLENAISPRKQTLGTLSNRHFLQVSASRNLRIAEADRPPQAASKSVSNRQWQILEINVNLSKQTIAPRSNRHKNALIKCQKSRATTPRHESRFTALAVCASAEPMREYRHEKNTK